MLTDKNIPKIDGMRIDEAHKGGGFVGSLIGKAVKAVTKLTGAPEVQSGPSVVESQASKEQSAELSALKKKEKAKVAAMARARQGRASLLSGAETGMKNTLGG